MEELKTTEAQRKAVREYEKMKELGIEKPNTFIKEVVAAELARMEKYRK